MNKPDIKIRFKSIEVLSKTMNPKPTEGFNDEAFHFDINGQLSINPKDKFIVCIITVTIREFNKENILANISIGTGFQLDNFDEVLGVPVNNLYNLPLELDALVKTMSISTVRGIIFSEFTGTYLYKAILPIIFLPPAPPIEHKKENLEITNDKD